MIDLYRTHIMLEAVKVMPPKYTFLRDRYFPTSARDIFPTKTVLIDFEDEEGNRLAPAVLPHAGGIPVAREGYETEEFEPPTLAPMRSISVDQLERRMAGENVFGGLTPEERAGEIIAKDLQKLNDLINAREEYMAAQTLLNNAYTLHQYADEYGNTERSRDKTIQFYAGDTNPAVYTPTDYWSVQSTSILADIAAMASMLTKRGLPATDLIVGSDVADVILANEEIQKLLDNRRYILTREVSPKEESNGATTIAKLNIKGRLIDIIAYDKEYTDEVSGELVPYIPANYCVMTAPAMGRTAYGAITQLADSSTSFETYAMSRVPQTFVDRHGNSRSTVLRSKPLVMPKVRNAAISAKVLL